MPVVQLLGGGGVFYISDLVNEVLIKVENRTTDTARAAVWLRDALIEISSNTDFRNDFVELEVVGPLFLLSPGVQEYDESNIVPSGDLNSATLDILMWQDPPSNKLRKQLDPSHYQETDRHNTVSSSQPTKWYRFGSNIGFDPVPDKEYQVQSRMLRNHPIVDTDPASTQILLPRDWLEILVWAAVERGFAELEEYEKSAAIHAMLFGDPKYPTRPGLLEGRKKKREREAWRKQQALRPVVRPYSYRGR